MQDMRLFQWYLSIWNINPKPEHCTYFYNEHLDLDKLNIISVFELLPPGPISNITTLHPMIWDGDLMALLAQNNFDKKYYTKTIFTVSTCAWFRETVMRRGLCTLHDQSPSALCWVIRWHVTCMLSLAEHWQGRRALSNHVCAHSVISMWHVVCLQHLARACSEQSRSTTVLPINHVIQMPQCLSGFVNHDYYTGF